MTPGIASFRQTAQATQWTRYRLGLTGDALASRVERRQCRKEEHWLIQTHDASARKLKR